MSNFWAYLKTRQFRNTILLVIATIIGIVLIAFFSLSSYTRHGQGIPVPTLKGLNVDKAMQLLKEQGFSYKIDSVYVPDQAPGTILEQDPDAGTNVKENRTIYLTMVTQLAPPVSLPDLITEQSIYREAVATLSNYGLKVGDTTYRSDIARDRVLEVRFGGQIIKPGTKIPKGSKLDLVLGNGAGASEVDIPELLNLDLDAARFSIKGAGLTVGTITYEGSITDSTNVVVVSQSPMHSDSLSKTSIGTRINLTVSQARQAMFQIDAVTLQQRIHNGESLNLLDVREAIEYHTFNIGGQNIPVGKLKQNIDSIIYNKTHEIIVICSAGIRSETALAILTESGFTHVVNFKGGLKALQKLNR